MAGLPAAAMDTSLTLAGSRRRTSTSMGKHYTAEDSALDQIVKEAEAKLAARRQARVEAREIRLRELEKQQRESEENADKDSYSDAINRAAIRSSNARSSSLLSSSSSRQSSRRSSSDSMEECLGLRDIRQELKEVEEKFKKAMVQNAQLDNEKSALCHQVDLFKDKLEDLEENHTTLLRQHRDKCREFDNLKRLTVKLKDDLTFLKAKLEEREKLIEERGLVIAGENDLDSESHDRLDGIENGHQDGEEDEEIVSRPCFKALVCQEVAKVLDKLGKGPLDVKLSKLCAQYNESQDVIHRLRIELEEEKCRSIVLERTLDKYSNNINGSSNSLTNHVNGPLSDSSDESFSDKYHASDMKFSLQKANQDIATLKANVARLEGQVFRYQTAAEKAEKMEEESKAEKRRLQQELRAAQTRLGELETSHSYLTKRLDKLKNAKSTLLKEL